MAEKPPTGPIQTLPRGLLGLLQLKNTGRNPAFLSDAVQSVIDIDSYYLRNQAHSRLPAPQLAVTGAAGAAAYNRFSTNPVIVPDNECWWVESFTLSMTLGAIGDRITNFQPMLFYNLAATNDFSFLANEGGYSVTRTAQTVNEGIFVSARGFWMPPGSELGVAWAERALTVATTCFGFVRKAILPI